MKLRALAIAAMTFLCAIGAPALAADKILTAAVDLSDQTLTVLYRGEALARLPVSTGRSGYRTPVGRFRPLRMYERYYSRQYDGAPMPHAIFYDGGYAIHGSHDIARLGQPASHGCVRLHPTDAAMLFELVLTVGAENTRVLVTQ